MAFLRSFIFVFTFSFRKRVKKIALTYLEKVGSGKKEFFRVRHVLVLKNPKFEVTKMQRFLFSMVKCQTGLYKCLVFLL